MHRSGKSAADLESLRQRLREDSPASTWPRGGSTFPQMVARRSCGRLPRPRSAGKSLRGPSMICGHRARVATGAARRRGRARSSAAPRRVHGSTNSTRAAQRRRRRRFLPQLSGGPISAPGVVDAHLCARRGAMTSRSLTATCPSAPRIGMLCVAALHGADDSRTAARKRQMRAPRGCFRPACVTTPCTPQWIFSTGFSHSQPSSEDGFLRSKTSPLQH
jgi:hypothetical protein